MPRTFLWSCEILFPVKTADRISGLGSVVLWLSSWGVVNIFSGNILYPYQRSSSVKGRLPSKVVFLFWVIAHSVHCLEHFISKSSLMPILLLYSWLGCAYNCNIDTHANIPFLLLTVLYVMLITNHWPNNVETCREASSGTVLPRGWLLVHMYSTTDSDSTVVVWLGSALTSVHNLYSLAPGLWPAYTICTV